MTKKDGWDIDLAGVRSVLLKTGGVADDIQGEVNSYSSNMESAGSSAGTLSMGSSGGGPSDGSGLVGAALQQFALLTQKDLMYVAARSGESISGAADATNAYASGDIKMAAQAQKLALQAPVIAPPGGGNPLAPSAPPGNGTQ